VAYPAGGTGGGFGATRALALARGAAFAADAALAGAPAVAAPLPRGGVAFALERGFALAFAPAFADEPAGARAALAGASLAAVAARPPLARSRLALRRWGRAFGKLARTSRSRPEGGSLEGMARILPYGCSNAPTRPKLETNAPV
jgi:hypothetical protein